MTDCQASELLMQHLKNQAEITADHVRAGAEVLVHETCPSKSV